MKNLNLEQSLNPNPNTNQTIEEELDDQAGLQASRIANAVAFPMVLKAALEIGVIDTISATGEGAWLSPSEIARGLPTKPTNPQAPSLLDRMLRLLASYSILKCRTVRTGEDESEREYATQPVCRFFLNGNQNSGSLVPLFMVNHSDVFIKTWNHLKDMILDGRDAFRYAHGASFFEYLGRDKPLNDLFNRAMTGNSLVIVKKALETYKGFEGVKVLVDVGGGVGTSLGLITSKYPHIKGINFDVANVIADAHSYPGVEHVAGDMFVEVPTGDAIFLKLILHNWDDDDCSRFLKNCWKALPSKGKAIIVDTVAPLDTEGDNNIISNIAFDFDMSMLVQCSGGKERTRPEFEALAKRSGFKRCEFICRAFYCWVIEFHKETYA